MSDSVPQAPRELTKDEQKCMIELKKICESWDLSEDQLKYIASDPFLYYRYSYGYGFDLKECSNYLKKMLGWRSKYKPETLRISDCQHLQKMFVLHHGCDKKGHPIVYMMAKNDTLAPTPENKLDKFKHVVYSYERAISSLAPEEFQITLVVDFKDASLTIDLIKSTKGLFDELGEYYAERIYQILVLNPPWTFGVCWAFLKPLLPVHVVKKYHVCTNKSEKDLRKELSLFIDPDQLAVYGTKDYKWEKSSETEKEKFFK